MQEIILLKTPYLNYLHPSYQDLQFQIIITYGGSLSYDQWFRGDASIFGGLEWRIPNIKGLNLKLEYDPL